MGIYVVEAVFPVVFAVFAARHLQPHPMLLFGAEINFQNYDAVPPSVRLVHPVTRERLRANQISYKFLRDVGADKPQEILQAFEGQWPFLCLPGIREYHDCSAHSGDSWLLYRGTTVGSLVYLLETMAHYGTEPLQALAPQLGVTGFAINAKPPS